MGFDGLNEKSFWELAETDFASALKRLIGVVGCSQYRLAEIAEFDRPYLLRLCSGKKQRPSRAKVLKLGAGLVRLGADVLAIDVLLLAAGLAPIFIFVEVPFYPGGKQSA